MSTEGEPVRPPAPAPTGCSNGARPVVSAGALTVKAEAEADSLAITAVGELDQASCIVLLKAIGDSSAAHSPNIVLRCGDLTVSDSSGVACVAHALRQTTIRGGRLLIEQPSAILVRALQGSGLEQYLDIA